MRTQYTLGLLQVYGVRRNKFKTYEATPVTRSPSVLLTLTLTLTLTLAFLINNSRIYEPKDVSFYFIFNHIKNWLQVPLQLVSSESTTTNSLCGLPKCSLMSDNCLASKLLSSSALCMYCINCYCRDDTSIAFPTFFSNFHGILSMM